MTINGCGFRKRNLGSGDHNLCSFCRKDEEVEEEEEQGQEEGEGLEKKEGGPWKQMTDSSKPVEEQRKSKKRLMGNLIYFRLS